MVSEGRENPLSDYLMPPHTHNERLRKIKMNREYARDFEEVRQLETIKRNNNKILRKMGHTHENFDNNMKAIKNVARAFNIIIVNDLGTDLANSLNNSISILKNNLNQANTEIQDAMYALKESMDDYNG